MSKDIRSFFSPKSVNAKNTAKQNVQPRAAKKSFLSDSDSNEEVPKKSKNKPPKKYAKLDIKKIKSVLSSDDEHEPKNQTKVETHKENIKDSKKRKRVTCLESSDEDVPNEQVSSKVRKKSSNSSTAKLKHFKPANPEDVFGTDPVKQSKSEITKLYTQKEEAPNETETNKSSTSGFKKDENQIGHTKKSNEDHMENEDDLSTKNEKQSTKKNKERKVITSPAKTINSQSIKQNAELVHSSTDKNSPNVDSLGDFSSPSCQKKSSPESSFKLSSQDSFVESQDSGIVMKKSVSNKYTKGSSQSEVRTSTFNSVSLPSRSTSVESKSTLESKGVKTAIDFSPVLWVDKYKPTSSSKLVGQQTPGSNVNKLKNWLINWHKNNSGHKKVTSVSLSWSMDPYGTNFKAALLSGPPGVGKTTTVQLLCKELGFDMVEFNASDTRSKNLLHTAVSELLTSTSLNSSFLGKCGDMSINRKRVLVMDEVDGMAGNEDRGGIQELISLIKRSKVPVICICNDRSHPKIRSLVNYCFDLRYSKPRIEQIRGYMMSICFKEKLNIPPDVLMDIIANTNNDIRLTLNHLSMLAADKTNTNLCSDKKNVKIGPWDILRKVFSAEEHKTMSIYDKCDLFFYDYSIAPLFVHENYLSVKPNNPVVKNKVKRMELFAEAADSLATGDVIESIIRKSSAWLLLPVQAIFSSYVPGFLLEGHCGGQINFPSWFAQNSKQSKMSRLLQEIQIHTRLKVSGSRLAILLDYANHIRNSILSPLLQDGADGVKTALDRLRSYDLLKDDLDNLNELSTWSQTENLFSKVDSKVKAAFTRLYNKEAPVCPYSLSVPIKSRKLNNDVGDQYDGENEEDEELDEDNEDTDAMIVEKKKPSKSVKPEKRVNKKGSDPSSTSSKVSRGKKAGGNKK